jgi:hypothetical protein
MEGFRLLRRCVLGKYISRVEFSGKCPSIDEILEKAEELIRDKIERSTLNGVEGVNDFHYAVCLKNTPKTKILLYKRGSENKWNISGFFGQNLILFNAVERVFEMFNGTFLTDRVTDDADYLLPTKTR